MRLRMAVLLGSGIIAGWPAFAGSSGQESKTAPPVAVLAATIDLSRPARDPEKWTPLQKQFDYSAVRGADWLFRANRLDGRFVPGYNPALQTIAEGYHFPSQAGAAFALARAGRYTGNEKYLARAKQVILTLLLDTTTDANDPKIRHTVLPSSAVNRLGAAGLLLMAIHELPAPGDDLLEQGEQLCAFIARQQLADGSLSTDDANLEGKLDTSLESAAFAGQALLGLIASERHRQAGWKTELIRKALPYYQTAWKAHPDAAMVPWHTAAFAEAYLRTQEKAFADFVFAMSDWICEMQYSRLDLQNPTWIGGFMAFANGKPVMQEPEASSALYAEGLVVACRAARQAKDTQRYQRYGLAAQNCLQFLTTLQYNEVNTSHFVDRYKLILLGGFHASGKNGNLHIEYAYPAVSSMVQFMSYLTE